MNYGLDEYGVTVDVRDLLDTNRTSKVEVPMLLPHELRGSPAPVLTITLEDKRWKGVGRGWGEGLRQLSTWWAWYAGAPQGSPLGACCWFLLPDSIYSRRCTARGANLRKIHDD